MSDAKINEKAEELPVSREHKIVVAEIERYVTRAERNLLIKLVLLIIAPTFYFGKVLAHIEADLEYLKVADQTQEHATTARVEDWTKWRAGVDERLADGPRDRFTGSHWNSAATIIMQRNKVSIPYMWELPK